MSTNAGISMMYTGGLDPSFGGGIFSPIKKGVKKLRKSKIISKTAGAVGKIARVADDVGIPYASDVARYSRNAHDVAKVAGFGETKPMRKPAHKKPIKKSGGGKKKSTKGKKK